MNNTIGNNSSLITHHSSLLLEIGTEEIPARFLPGAIQGLKENAATFLKETYIDFSEIQTYATPRRLSLIATGLPVMQEARVKEIFGPPKKAAFDKDGRPTKAAIGFAQTQGVSVESLTIKSKDKGEYVVAVIEEKGIPVKDLLPEVFKRLVLSIRFPKTMRWGNGSMRFARPIHWLLALFGNDVVHFEIDEIKSSNMTRGHRFLSPGSFKVEEISTYKDSLKNKSVILDHYERKHIILDGIRRLSAQAGGMPVEDEELIETVNFLVEYPVPVLCSFLEDYLKLPKELLITVMKDHQKYFAIKDNEGKLTNNFIVISNTKVDNAEAVRVGAERVIKARFEDARFYFEEDSKKPLYERIEDLKKVTFHDGLGSLYEKTKRIASIAEFLAGRFLPSEKDKLSRAAWLSKTDLITGSVREFPELQGIMGKYYAILDGEDSEVAKALEEHYLPAHSGGKLPQTEIGALLSIADKIDNIAAFFSIGLIPTGSEDPFALRRQALGIIAIILDKGHDISIKDLIDKALENLSNIKDFAEVRKDILQFFEQRFESVFSDQGYGTDLIYSILPLSLDLQLKDIKERLNALQKFKELAEYDNFLLAIKRVNNIIPKAEILELKTELLIEESEKKLKESLDSVRSGLTGLLQNRKYYDAIQLLSSLNDPVNQFFDRVLVMDKRDEIKQNRLALLKEIWTTAYQIADFSKLKESR
ncbi:MAG: glycine--tRNA ligase subunit beta [Nitrospira sp.]|nr:glycine--tRNA ligase subunit beta [Nitrospira sp.]